MVSDSPQHKILDALKVLPASRNEAWEKNFLSLLPLVNVRILHAEPQMGPDSWPYLFVEISDLVARESDEPCQRVIEWLSEKGIGLAVNPGNAIPDFVLTYGMLCNYRMTGQLLSDVDSFGPSEIQSVDNQVFLAEPNENYLPVYLRQVLRDFFRDQKVEKPLVTLISADKKIYDIAFSLESLGSPPIEEHAGISEAISWFLPAHYGIVLLSEKRVSGGGFLPL